MMDGWTGCRGGHGRRQLELGLAWALGGGGEIK